MNSMKKTEKILSGAITVLIGVLLIILKAKVISIAMTVIGIALLVAGFIDLAHEKMPSGVCKIVAGGVIILCGWVIVSAVLYILAAFLIIAGILMLYEKVKKQVKCNVLWKTICEYAFPAMFLIIGLCLLFNQGNTINWFFVVSGIFTVLEGGLLILLSLIEEEN